MYVIRGLCHSVGAAMAAHSFQIDLHPLFQACVAYSGLTQEMADRKIEVCGRQWLDAAGYNALYDPVCLIQRLPVRRRSWDDPLK
jgi:hypothetical protein